LKTKVVCPVMVTAGAIAWGAARGAFPLPRDWAQCLTGECAWYDAAAERCALLELARRK
jgi:hypothetical protein